MGPKTSRDFQKAAWQRFNTAVFLLENKYTLDAEYLGGYSIECSLKALILEKSAVPDRPSTLKDISSGAHMHRSEVLLGVLRDLGIKVPGKLAKRYPGRAWSTDLRYETGHRDTGEVRGFLKTAKATLEWVEGQLS